VLASGENPAALRSGASSRPTFASSLAHRAGARRRLKAVATGRARQHFRRLLWPRLTHLRLSDDGVRHALSVMGLTRWATQTNVRQVFALVAYDAQSEPPYGSPHRSTEPLELLETIRVGLWEVPTVVLTRLRP